MKGKYGIAVCILGALLFASGCVTPQPPAETSTGKNGLQQRTLTSRNIGSDMDATYDDVWYGVISTLQLNGFILKQADKASGFIYGVWQDTYERQTEYSNGGFVFTQAGSTSSLHYGNFFSRTSVYKQVEVSVTLEPLAPTQTLVRLVSRFDNQGVPTAHGIFANRFFGLLRKDIFLRKNGGSIYQKYSTVANKKYKD